MEQKLLTKSNIIKVAKYILFFGLFYLLFKTSINGFIMPFAFGMLFALIWCNQNILILTPLYVGANYLAEMSLNGLYSSLATVLIILICYGIHIKFKKPIKPIMLLIYALVSQALSIYLKIDAGTEIYIVFIELVVGLLFMFASMKFFETVVVRGVNGRLTAIEIICGACVLASIFCGLSYFKIQQFELVKLFACFIILFTAFSCDAKTCLFIATVMGVGTLFYNNNPVYIAPFIIWAVVATLFKTKNRIFSAVAVLVAEVLLGFYFELYYMYNAVSISTCIIAALLFLALPSKLYTFTKTYYSTTFGSMAMQSIVEQSRNGMYKRLNQLGDIFAEMDKVFRSMIKGKMAKEELKSLMISEIKTSLCVDCPEKNKCFRTYGNETNAILESLTTVAFDKGKITLIDIPAVLTSRCFRINQLVYRVNELIEQYKNYAGLMNSIDASRVLVAEQLYGVSVVMKQLAGEMGKKVIFDKGSEKRLIEELTYNNIICSDALLYHEKNDIVSATIAVRKEDSLKSKIPAIVSKVCKNKMIVVEEESSARAGWQVLNLKTAPKFDIVFGTNSCTKATSSQSGDSYSVIRLQNDKILMALCDGMGSGEKAEKASNIAISLVENFYKAGFENDLILSSVNKFLSIGKEDVFSCLDMAVIDLRQGIADYIKLGATNGFVKHGETTEIIETGALPLGIISNVEPAIKKSILMAGDMIVICTDGISDSFKNDEELCDFINNTRTLNPQELADTLIQTAIENCGGSAKDDMTVIVAKVFART